MYRLGWVLLVVEVWVLMVVLPLAEDMLSRVV